VILENNKELIKIVDVLGREVNPTKNTQLFYIYNEHIYLQELMDLLGQYPSGNV